MRTEKLLAQQEALADAEAIVATNLLGPIRLTAALLPLLQKQPRSVIMNVSSGLAFVPIAPTPAEQRVKRRPEPGLIAAVDRGLQLRVELVEFVGSCVVDLQLALAHNADNHCPSPADG